MKRLLVILLSSLITFSGITQNIERHVLNTSGGNFENASLQISSSIGEAVIGSVLTGSLTVMQGFQVGGTEAPTGITYREVMIYYTIYPNPTMGQLNIAFDSERPVELILELIDLNGNNIQSKNFRIDASFDNVSLDIGDLDEGLYLLQIHDKFGQQLRVFKIFKKN